MFFDGVLFSFQFIVRVAKAFNSVITFPVVMTSEPPCVRPSIDPVLSQHIYRALADYLVARASADLANDETGQEETEAAIGEDASNHTGRLSVAFFQLSLCFPSFPRCEMQFRHETTSLALSSSTLS